MAVDQQSFSPVRRLTTPDTDEVSIDVEVVGTSSINPGAHFLTPRRSLQLRLERAYVDTLLWRDTQGSSFSALSLSLDSGSKQPRSISWARMYKDKGSPKDITRDAVVAMNRRTLIIQIDGHRTVEKLRADSTALLECRGAAERSDLFAVESNGSRYCEMNSRIRSTKKYLAMISPDLAAQIICTDDLIGCRLSFPFDSFAPTVVFHQDRLPEWMNVVREASDFLQSKKFDR